MRKSVSVFVLVFLVSSLSAQKITDWEGGNPGPHIPSRNIYEKVNRSFAPGAGAEEVRQALLEMKPVLSASGCGLALEDSRESLGGFHYSYRQTYRDIPVYLAGIKANLNPDKRMVSLLNNLRSIVAPTATFRTTDQELEDHLYAAYFRDQPDFSFEYERVWFARESGTVPAFRIELAFDARLWEIVLADQDLDQTLSRRDLASYCRPLPPPADTVGRGMVFDPDPLSSSGQVYGGNYVDANDADSPFLNNQRVMVDLLDINWNGTYFLLDGPHVRILDVESPSVPPVFSINGDFFYNRSEAGFEDVMVYYHIDSYQRYIQSLGFTNLMNAPLTADPHGLFGQDNSHFVPQGGNVRVAFGEGGVDDAEDADVIVHEYGHALSYSAAPGTNGGTERQGLDEGIGDYIAASYSKSKYYALWKNTFTWDGHNEYWIGRSASTSTLYPPNTADIYTYGEIWASTLMEVHDEIGRTASDKVFFESLFGNYNSMTLTDAARIIMDADSALFGGAHSLNYQSAFCRRGIFTGTAPGQGCYVGLTDPGLHPDAWQLFPNPTQTALNIHLPDIHRRKDVRFRVLSMLGKEVYAGEVRQEFTEVRLPAIGSGLYLVELWQGGTRLDSKRLEIMH